MRKVIFGINITIDGYADHTAGIVDDELHHFFTNLLGNSDVILFAEKPMNLWKIFGQMQWQFAKQ